MKTARDVCDVGFFQILNEVLHFSRMRLPHFHDIIVDFDHEILVEDCLLGEGAHVDSEVLLKELDSGSVHVVEA